MAAKNDPATELRISKALGILFKLVNDHGPKSDPVRDFIRATHRRGDMGDFKSLAFTVLLMAGWKKETPTVPYRNRRAPPR